ncbi:MAG: M48 family metallopeptidase [Coriobacteriia bacterium]|nr:M48 family metallopeptidase [Coriobacteriia bacterium]
MSERRVEVVRFDDMDVSVRREPTHETYLALEPPDALPYVVAPLDKPIADVGAFVQSHLDVLRELRLDMLKHFKKTKSLRCRFKTGDVAYLLGRPFMIRSNPLSTNKKVKATRTRATLQATMHADYSLINLQVVQSGNYDQGKAAFMGFAQTVFSNNIGKLTKQCMGLLDAEKSVPSNIGLRPMRDTWVIIDDERDVVWFSESLIPYPAHAVVYAFANEAVKKLFPDADEAERERLLDRAVPDWQAMRDLLASQDDRYIL